VHFPAAPQASKDLSQADVVGTEDTLSSACSIPYATLPHPTTAGASRSTGARASSSFAARCSRTCGACAPPRRRRPPPRAPRAAAGSRPPAAFCSVKLPNGSFAGALSCSRPPTSANKQSTCTRAAAASLRCCRIAPMVVTGPNVLPCCQHGLRSLLALRLRRETSAGALEEAVRRQLRRGPASRRSKEARACRAMSAC